MSQILLNEIETVFQNNSQRVYLVFTKTVISEASLFAMYSLVNSSQ
jgi:hypothetical protein